MRVDCDGLARKLRDSPQVRRLRIEYAKIQLLRTDEPLAAIAVDSGFADQSHFTRTFARVEGTTPGRFRSRRACRRHRCARS